MCKRTVKSVRLTRKFHWLYMGPMVTAMALILAISFASMLMNVRLMAESNEHFPALQAEAILAALAMASVVLLVGLAILTAHRISGPHLKMMHVCEQISKGDQSARLYFRESDGLDEVQSAFNEMVDTLVPPTG